MSKREFLRRLLFVAFAIALVAPIFDQPFAYPKGYDFRYFIAWIEAGRRSLLWYGDFPLWNPWTCGGQVYLANPQSTIAAPTFALALLFGTALGTKLMLVSYLFFAQDGMYRLARQLDPALDADAAMLAAIVFGGSGWFGLHLSSGHLNFAGAALFPYLLLCHRRALLAWEWSIPLGALMAWIVGLGGTSTAAMATMLLSLSALIEILRRPSLRPLWVLWLAALCSVLIGGARLLPVFEFVRDHPRPMFETDHNTVPFLLRNALMWQGVQGVAGKRYWFHEYGWKLPYVAAPLLLLSLRWLRSSWQLWLLFASGLAIAAGAAWPYGPWWLMKHLPLFKDLRVPSRYVLLCGLAAAPLIGVTAQRLLAGRSFRKPAMWALGLLCAADAIAYSGWLYRDTFVLDMTTSRAPFHQVQGHWQQMLSEILLNHGVIGCDEESPLQRAATLDLGDVPQARMADPSTGSVMLTRFSPSRLALHVEASSESLVLLNTNWNEHWHSSRGAIVKYGDKHPRDRDGGRLAVRLPQGSHDLVVSYRPRSFSIGLGFSLFGGTALAALFAWQQRRRRRA